MSDKKRKEVDFETTQKFIKKTTKDVEISYNSNDEKYEQIYVSDWIRPPVLPYTINDSLCFQQLDIDYYIRNSVPIIRIFGVTDIGNTICCHVHNFFPYFYVTWPVNIQIETLKKKLYEKNIFANIENVSKQSIYGYHNDKDINAQEKFLKIIVTSPELIPKVKCYLESINDSFNFYESNIDFIMRFMVDAQLFGCCWIELLPGTWNFRNESFSHFAFNTGCQIEVDLFSWDKLVCHEPEEDWGRIAPLRILSFDIECAGRKGIFPKPEIDPVIQIGNIAIRHGETEPFANVIFTLGECSPIKGTKIFSFNEEGEMLKAWSKFICFIDPDIITGYNINDFDFSYLLNRAIHLKCESFPLLGRVKGVKSTIKCMTIKRKHSKIENKNINMEGRCILDMLPVIRKEHKIRSYSLNAVSVHFLSEQKEDLHHSIISDLQNGDAQSRRRIAVYCMKDTDLVMKLINKLLPVINYIEMARVTGISLNSVINRGQQVKVLSQILRKAKTRNLILPTIEGEDDQEYEGATVIEPKKGFYNCPIVTLDFASLYPSIMIAHNLCYTTLVKFPKNDNIDDEIKKNCIMTPSNHFFVKAEKLKGLIPDVLESFLTARKKAKTALKIESDEWKRKVLDGRQLAYKILANSVYGFTGAQLGKLPCLEISKSVTAFGRTMIAFAKKQVEEKYTIAHGYVKNCNVIYGDTDSIMIDFGIQDLAGAFSLGKEAAAYVSKSFPNPIKLEFEKIYFPYLLINKKRYAGLYFTKVEKYDKIDCRGLETVRRDNCPLVGKIINVCLEKILIHRDPKGAINYAKEVISDLLQNKIDISQLVITKELTKSEKEYVGKQAHVQLAHKMKKRDIGTAPKLGDRIPYVIVCGARKSKIYENAEDPLYVLENNIPIDFNYYLKNQLSKPLIRIFEPILGEKAEHLLLSGDHALTKTIPIRKSCAMSKFLKIRLTCIQCKIPLNREKNTDPQGALCNQCRVQCGKLVYDRESNKLKTLEDNFANLKMQCQQCMDSTYEEIICTNFECPIFYSRKKVELDLEKQSNIIKRFDLQ